MSENLENSKQIEEENDPDNVRDSICSKSIQSQLERKIDSISNDHDINDSEDEKESDNENQLNEIDQEQNNSPDQTELFNSLNRRDMASRDSKMKESEQNFTNNFYYGGDLKIPQSTV